jgi:glycosyltransferase involved in cell wall biosynthesis
LANDTRTRVLWCIKCLGYGGAERLLVSTAAVRDTDRFHYEVAYVLPSKKALVPEMQEAGVPVHCLGSSDGNLDLRWMANLRRLLTERHFDIVHFHLPYTAALGRLVVRSLPASRRPKTMTTEHNVWATNAGVVQLLNHVTLPLDAAHVAVSDSVREAVPARHRRRVEVVVHGVAPQDHSLHATRRAEVRKELGVADQEILVGTVANMRPGKGYETLLPVARALVDLDLPVRFAAVGEGPLQSEITALHRRLGLGDRFLLLGGRSDAVRVLAGFDVFTLASLSEGLPVSFMEALSLGVPTVTTAVGGMPDVVTEGQEGLIVPPGDHEELARALTRMVMDGPGRARMAVAARACGAQFDISAAAQRVESIYSDVLEASSYRGVPALGHTPVVGRA